MFGFFLNTSFRIVGQAHLSSPTCTLDQPEEKMINQIKFLYGEVVAVVVKGVED